MSQRRLHSLVEALFNTWLGMGLSLLVGYVIYPLFGHAFSWSEMTGLTAIFTVVSIVRGYIVRRLFNWLHGRGLR